MMSAKQERENNMNTYFEKEENEDHGIIRILMTRNENFDGEREGMEKEGKHTLE